MSRDRPQRFLAVATVGLPRGRAEWGAAMRSELASIDDPNARRQFARSAGIAAFKRGLGIRVCLPILAGLWVGGVVLAASRLQLANGGSGLLPVTVPVPALVLLLLTLLAAGLTRSFRFGLETGFSALLVSSVVLFAVLALEGIVWMDRLGVFILDADPPKSPVNTVDVVFDVFSTGMWVGHTIVWFSAMVIGASLGALLGQRMPSPTGGVSPTATVRA
jgi:hypothetical protein